MFRHGKNYKHCNRMHELLTLEMESLHFESFLENQEDRNDIIFMIMTDLNTMKSKQDNQLMD